jgi:ribosomal protein L37E
MNVVRSMRITINWIDNMKCDQCGYHPRASDKANIVLDNGKDNIGEKITYVRCYRCGDEWIE